MAKIITKCGMCFSSFGDATYKIIPKGTVLELVSCRHECTRRDDSFFTTHWRIVINTEDGELFSYPFVTHRGDAPMEECRPFIYLENQ